jgi:hypothetical protein
MDIYINKTYLVGLEFQQNQALFQHIYRKSPVGTEAF